MTFRPSACRLTPEPRATLAALAALAHPPPARTPSRARVLDHVLDAAYGRVVGSSRLVENSAAAVGRLHAPFHGDAQGPALARSLRRVSEEVLIHRGREVAAQRQ